MLDFILASENFPFSVALAIMLGIAALEGVGALVGLSISMFLESLFPGLDMDVDGQNIKAATTLSQVMSWLRIGRVPLLILIIIFLTTFGLLGLLIQNFALGVSGMLLPAWLAVLPALVGAIPCVRFFGNVFGKLLPQDETEAVSEESLIGRIAIITLGTATPNSPAEARVKDEHHQSHYIMVTPENAHEQFESGTVILLVKKSGPVFTAITNPNKSLV